MSDVIDLQAFRTLRVYTPTVYYADTRQYTECFGHCEEVVKNEGTERWTIMRCLYCHAKELPCLAEKQDGTGCRRHQSLRENGLCSQHQ